MSDAKIAENGAILLGENIVCDAHSSRPIRVITHAHSDHLLHLKKSLSFCEKVIATPVTRDFIGVLKGENLADSIIPLDYEKSYEYKGEWLTLYPAYHIIGSAQVLLKNREGKRILYTGDFRFPPAKIIKTDILVIEATYGNPAYVRNFSDAVESELINLVKESLKENPVYIFGYHGKLQEVVKILNDSEIDVPIVVSEKVFQILEICQSHGLGFKDFYLSKSEAGLEIQKRRHIGVYHVGAYRWVGQDSVKIMLSGWQFDVPCKRIGQERYRVALSDHCDFNQLMEYIAQIHPRSVVTDGYRAGDAPLLAQEIRNRLGIPAISMPEQSPYARTY